MLILKYNSGFLVNIKGIYIKVNVRFTKCTYVLQVLFYIGKYYTRKKKYLSGMYHSHLKYASKFPKVRAANLKTFFKRLASSSRKRVLKDYKAL